MSASIPDHRIAAVSAPFTPTYRAAKVVQLPIDEAARRRQEALRVNLVLRTQLGLLSRHYAEDTVRMHDALQSATLRAHRAQGEVERQRASSAGVEAELFAARGDLQFVRERLSKERRRAARLAEIARLPWWAFARRHWSLASLNVDEAD
jgi:U3 small nucleolar RNA-associated protein 14